MLTTISTLRRPAVISACLFIFFAFSGLLYAESVFLKDGSIVEGKIVKEDDLKITVQISSGEIREISRENILRTNYQVSYKEKKFIKKNDGTEIEGYFVDEDSISFTYREKLNLPDEIKIRKDEIRSISKERIIEQYDPPAGYYLRGIVPGWGQFYSGHYIKSSILGVSFIGSAVWGVKANMQYSKSKKDYESLPAGTTQAELDSAFNQSAKDGKFALLSILTASFIYALNWVDIILLSKPESDNISMARYGEVYVNLNIIPEYPDFEFIDNSKDLKAEVAVSVRF